MKYVKFYAKGGYKLRFLFERDGVKYYTLIAPDGHGCAFLNNGKR